MQRVLAYVHTYWNFVVMCLPVAMTMSSGMSFKQPADGNPRASLGIGVVTLLISRIMGDFAPKALTDWTVAGFPARGAVGGNVWIPTVFGSFPGS